jgi:hypothetical protein
MGMEQHCINQHFSNNIGVLFLPAGGMVFSFIFNYNNLLI